MQRTGFRTHVVRHAALYLLAASASAQEAIFDSVREGNVDSYCAREIDGQDYPITSDRIRPDKALQACNTAKVIDPEGTYVTVTQERVYVELDHDRLVAAMSESVPKPPILDGAPPVDEPAVDLVKPIWSGDYETGDFGQWHSTGKPGVPNYSQMPKYGAPDGDGSLLRLVTSPVRQGKYAAQFTVKSRAGGGVESADCDHSNPDLCSRRRTELTGQGFMPLDYDAMPYMSERWMSVSHYVPEDWDVSGRGWGVILFQVKPLNESGLSPVLSIALEGDHWSITHRWDDARDPSGSDVPWQQQMIYTGDNGGPYPRENNWLDGLKHFPSVQDSYDALTSVNRGGWTDWIMHVKYDARGSRDGGTGFFRLWKREGNGDWTFVLNITPGLTTRGGMTFDHGVGYNSPANGSNPGGFGIKAGMYMEKGQVWDLPRNRVVINDNIHVYPENASFSDLVP